MPVTELFAVVAAFASGFSAALEPSTVPIESTISAQAEAMESATLVKVEAAVAEQLRAHEARRSALEGAQLQQTAVTTTEVAFDVDTPTEPLTVLDVFRF